jgi:hypothetical protein
MSDKPKSGQQPSIQGGHTPNLDGVKSGNSLPTFHNPPPPPPKEKK